MGPWPLVGRDEELRFAVEAVRGDTARGIVVAGALGVGKSRLARAALDALDGEFASEWVAASVASAQIPFGAVAHLVDDAAATTPDDRLRVARSVASSLAARAGDRPLVLAVDDAQWLDPGTAALVHQFVVNGTAKVVLTLRTDEPAPDPVVACWKDGWTERLELQPLGAVDVDDLVGTVVGRAVDRATLQRFWSLSKGNPLFLHELVRGALEARAFTVHDGVWSWTGDLGASDRLLSILATRLSRVTPPGRVVLDTLAVGEPLALATLVDVVGAAPLLEVERLGLAMVDGRDGDQVRLCHPLYGEALRGALGAVARRRIMATLADALGDGVGLSAAQRLRIAVWRFESGTPVSPERLTEAATTANAMYDHVLSERLARRALADGAGLPAALVLGDALNRQGRCVEGLAVVEPFVGQGGSDDEHLRLAITRYFALTTEQGFRAELADVLVDAERQVADPRSLAFLRAQRAQLLCSAGHLDEGVALALETIEAQPDEVTQLRAVSPLASAWLCGGRSETACAMTTRMLEPAVRLREQVPQAPGWVMSLHLPALAIAGRLDEADAAADLIEQAVTSSGGTADASAFIALARGMTSLQRGAVERAVRSLRESVALLRPIARWRLPFALVQLVEASALVGDADGAAAASGEADELVAHHAVFEGAARRARGWAALARGERTAAIELWLDAADWSRANGHRTAELFALHDAVRLGAARRAVEQLAAVAADSEGRWAPVLAAHGRAAAAGDADALGAAAAGFEGIGARLLAAEAHAQASAVLRDAGLRTRADRAAARAFQLASACEGARSPALEELQRPLPLTRREREVAELAAGGLSSQAIADRLFVSVRTVEGHLQNAYAKLGVNDRSGLRGVLRQPVAAGGALAGGGATVRPATGWTSSSAP